VNCAAVVADSHADRNGRVWAGLFALNTTSATDSTFDEDRERPRVGTGSWKIAGVTGTPAFTEREPSPAIGGLRANGAACGNGVDVLPGVVGHIQDTVRSRGRSIADPVRACGGQDRLRLVAGPALARRD